MPTGRSSQRRSADVSRERRQATRQTGAPTKGPMLKAGRVYRTRDLSQWTAKPARLARRLVDKGQLEPLAHGLFVHPRRGRFGVVPPTDEQLMRAFLGGPFVLTGPERWNALGLGTSAAFATQLVYNTKRSGAFTLGGRRFLLQRVAFPKHPSPEWFVVDLLQHAEQAVADRDELEAAPRRRGEASPVRPRAAADDGGGVRLPRHAGASGVGARDRPPSRLAADVLHPRGPRLRRPATHRRRAPRSPGGPRREGRR